MKRAKKNAGLTAADIARLGPKARAAIGTVQEESGAKKYQVSWYSPWLKKRVTAGALIEAASKGGAIAEVKASLGHRTFDKRQKLKPTNFIAAEALRNPTRPFFCADCDDELKSDSVMMGDGRVICPRCVKKAREVRQSKQQRKLFDEQSPLFQNPTRLRNVEMGFVDRVGVFHPIRKSKDYNEFLSGDLDTPEEKRERRLKYQSKQMREWYAGEEKKRAKQFAKSHKSLSQFVRASGGINAPKDADLRGELRMLGRKESGTTGLLNQHNRQGSQRYGPEYMMDAANTEGYRDKQGREFDNIGNFLSAVADDARGTRKLYSQGDAGEFYNPMTKKKKAAKGKGRGAKKNFLGLDRSSRVKRHKKRARVSAAKAGLLEAKDRLRAARKNPKRCRPGEVKCLGLANNQKGYRRACQWGNCVPEARVLHVCDSCIAKAHRMQKQKKNTKKAARKGAKVRRTKKPQPRQVFYFEVKTNRRRVQGIVSAPNIKGATKRLRDKYGAQGIRQIAVRNPTNLKALASLGVLKNPMNVLEIGSHVATMLMGAQVARDMTRTPPKAKKRKPTAKAAARRLAEQRKRKKNGLIEIAAGLQAANYLERELSRGNRKARRNGPPKGNTPALQKIHQDFLGRKNTGRVIKLYTPPGSPKHAGAMAKLTALHVKKSNGRIYLQPFAKGSAWIGGVQNGDWRRMVIGLKQPFAMPNGLDPDKAHNYGEVVRIEYIARKPHLYGENSPEYPFFHEMGEEGGKRPHLILQNGCLAFRGGGYGIKREGIRN